MNIKYAMVPMGRALWLVALCACASTRGEIVPSKSISATGANESGKPLLYARDGSVVAGDQPGSITTTAEPTRDVASNAGSRMYLLDLYQKAMDEKDALALEVKGLNAALTQEQSALETLTKERDNLAAQLQTLQGENQRVTSENSDLAARLTTAQIRRLEAEKLLLEAQIEWQLAQAAELDAARKNRTQAAASRIPGDVGTHPLKRDLRDTAGASTSPADTHTQAGKP